MKTNIFSFNRLGLLFQRFFAERSRYELIQWVTMMIVFMFIRNINPAMLIAILVSGVIYASNFYKEIHSSGNGAAYFMIPASQLEKTIVGVVITSFYYFAMIIITYVIGNLLGTLLNNLIASTNVMQMIGLNFIHHSDLQWKLFDISLKPEIIEKGQNFFERTHSSFFLGLFGLFLLGQSIYLLGSIYFKRVPFFATLLALNVIQTIIGIVFLTEFVLIVGNIYNLGGISNSYDLGQTVGHTIYNLVHKLPEIIFWLLSPFFWIVSYFRLTEKQV